MNQIFPAMTILVVILQFVGCSGNSNDKAADSSPERPPLASRLNSVDAAEQQQQDVREQDVRQAPSGMASGEETSDQAMDAEGDTASTEPTRKFGGALFPDFVPDPMAKTALDSDSTDNADMAADETNSDENDADPFDLGDSAEDMSSKTESDMASKDQSAMSDNKSVTLLPDAKRLFQAQVESDAINVLYAHHLVSDASREDYKLNWYAGLKEPRLLFRWGVGVIYSAPSDYSGRLPVIGDPGDENEGGGDGGRGGNASGRSSRGPLSAAGTGGGGGGGGGGDRPYKNIDTSRPDGFLLYYTGDFGTKLVSELEKRALGDPPRYGRILHDVMEAQLPANDELDENTADRGGGGSPPAQSIGVLGMDDDGDGGRGGGPQRGDNPQSPDSGDDATPVEPPDLSVIERAMGSDTAAKPDEELSGSILPGVMLLGVGSKAELIERAQRESVDSLIIFNVNVSKSRGSSRNRSGNTAPPQYSTTSLKIIDIQSEKAANLFSSRALKDVDVQEKIDEGKDPVQIEIDRAFAEADEQFTSADLPSGLNPENVKSRIGRLLQQQHANPLRAAVEIVSFYEIKLLPEDLAIAAITRLFGSDAAKVLINGSEQQRFEFLKAWLPDGLGA